MTDSPPLRYPASSGTSLKYDVNMFRNAPLFAVMLGIVVLACGGDAEAGGGQSAPPTVRPSADALPSATTTPVPIAGEACGVDAQNIESKILSCGDRAIAQVAARLPALYFHFDPKVPEKVRRYVEGTAKKYLPIYGSFFDYISEDAQIHIVLSLTPRWCAKELLLTDDGTEESLLKDYCQQDGGANGGHGTMRFAEYGSIILRPNPDDVSGILKGKTDSDMLTQIMVAEMGHASRDIASDAITGERGIAKWTPVWLNYVPNQFGWFYSGLKEGISEGDFTLATWGQTDLAWRPTVTDPRFKPWNVVSEWQLGSMERPSLYNVAHLAMRYLVPKHGIEAIARDLMGTLFVTTSQGGNYDVAARRLGYASWADLEASIDQSIIRYYKKQGIAVPN